MKKQVYFSMIILIAVFSLIVFRITVGYEADYPDRGAQELEGVYVDKNREGRAAAEAMLQHPDDQNRFIQQTEDALNCMLMHFGEITKGNRADRNVVGQVAYHTGFLYALYLNSDFNQEIHTDTEKKLWRSTVSRYVCRFELYADDAIAGRGERGDLFALRKLERPLEKNIRQEAEHFVQCLFDVISEAEACGWI